MIEDYWYIAAPGSLLKKKPLQIRVLNQDIVLFRSADGTACALLDQCCHRGMALSLGAVVQGSIQCPLHGWQFGSDGQCTEIPSLKKDRKIPRSACVRSFQSTETDGYIWVWMGTGRAVNLPSIQDFNSKSWVQGHVHIQASALSVLDINLDDSHVYFAHPTHPATKLNKKNGFGNQAFEIRMLEKGFAVINQPTQSATEPIPKKGRVTYFELPGLIKIVDYSSKGESNIILIYAIPTGDHSCRLEFMYGSNLKSKKRIHWFDGVPDIIAEDIRLLEPLQEKLNRSPLEMPVSVGVDTPGIILAKIFKHMANQNWESVREKFPERQIIQFRS